MKELGNHKEGGLTSRWSRHLSGCALLPHSLICCGGRVDTAVLLSSIVR
jgi:hypothetical protein